jgi:NitT/TauT family transport system substrate-binding protein
LHYLHRFANLHLLPVFGALLGLPWPTAGRVRRRRAARLAVGVMAAGLLTAGCSSQVTAEPTASVTTHVTVFAQQVVDDAPFWIALKDGFFKAQGLSLTVKPLAKTTLGLPGLESGQESFIVGGNFPTMLQADASGQLNVRIVAEGYQGAPRVMEVLALPRSHITDAADLAHKTVAVNLNGGIQTLTLNAVLSAEGVKPATVHYTVVPFPEMAAALMHHKVDAVDMLEPFMTQAELGEGAIPVVDQLTGPTSNFPISGVFTTGPFATKHPGIVAAFQRAMFQAQAFADTHRAAVEQILPTYIKGVTSTVAALVNLGDFPTGLDPIPIQRVADLMFASHLLPYRLAVADLLFRTPAG